MIVSFLYFTICSALETTNMFTSSMSGSEDERAVLIAESATNKIDKCFDDLGAKLNCMCVNLDANKRKSLTISIMICEHNRDGRLDQLPKYDGDDDDFIAQLDNENFKIFTTLYTSIDSVCFHAAHEHLSTDNLQKILNVYKAVTLSTEFLIAARDNLDQTTRALRGKLVDVQQQIYLEAASISNMTELIKSITERITEITSQASFYKNSVSNAKYYLSGVGLSIIVNFVFPNVFMPVLFVTGIYLFLEVNLGTKYAYYLTGNAFKYSYVFICCLVFLISLWDRLGLIKVKLFSFKKRRGLRIPRLHDD
ncbi:hypothetical protein TRFO_40446 [Tritrichomonas foetus]|uniref:Uncharacterized protein n=1 Tax=Tritrichomonas foetus TaxID=1144522 RepID=A0A1J4J7Q4_9EUKA|nr:hypothetical protein TRFO_40446 [Tritrichomonas foetus]|eukprot:OHS93252.1 hypothetical protein TRFO_40446 [Tritrichomonas foetus]